ncbi:MAG: HD domain-containing protein [Atopobiaceae bacterium]|nr:HD domain-containing protein [Atopobiaceae bacterium]
MHHYQIYHDEMPSFLNECIKTPIIERIKLIGMNCGCEYTAFPQFADLAPYSRYDHSLGVALIVWHFTHDRKQAVAGLLHDVASPVFAHVVDFMHGDYFTQESTEDGTETLIANSTELQAVLRKLGLTTEDVCDYHRYPIADNDSPLLSADRLEYTIGNSLNYGICTLGDVQRFYGDLVIGVNEDGDEELMFKSLPVAEAFAKAALACSRIYICDEDRYAMQMLSEILRFAIEHRVIEEEDLHSTEPEVIDKLVSNVRTASLWNSFCAYSHTISAPQPGATGCWRRIIAKRRFIDPMVQCEGRVSELSPAFADSLNAFQNNSYDYWVCGQH